MTSFMNAMKGTFGCPSHISQKGLPVHFTSSSFVFILFLSTANAEALRCIKGEITEVRESQPPSHLLEYCHNSTATVLISKKCEKRACAAFLSSLRFSPEELNSEYGKPGFALCRKLGGKPELIVFKPKNKAYPLDRCVFEPDVFVDTGTLMRHYIIK